MKHLTLAATFCLLAAPAFAGQCPMDMAKVDAALAANSTLSAAQLAEVQALRAEGQALHESGDHAASVATLAEAKGILGIQ